MEENNLEYYLERYRQGTTTPAEAAALLRLLEEPGQDEALNAIMDEQLRRWQQADISFAAVSGRIKAALLDEIAKGDVAGEKPAPVRAMKKWYRVAAACIVMVLGLGVYLYLSDSRPSVHPVVHTPDIHAPAVNRAMITLADGRRVFLDSAGNGQLAQLGNVQLMKLANGQIAYQYEGASPHSHPGEGPDRYREGGEAAYNTLTNPRSSKVIDMTLSDGSRVWLNAGSSITYPVAFTGSERKVTMTGEAYFEVAHKVTASGAKQSFIVEKNDMQVTVLGTHFNVNAYDDESDIEVTLLEGSVKTSNSFGDVMLRPGQQATITKNQKPETRNNIDLEQVMAWKNGLFDFTNMDIKEIMRQAARWYDVDVVFAGAVSDEKYIGKVDRNTNLSEMMKILELNGVKYRVEGKRIIISR